MATLVYFPVKLDYDDYPIGSPGTMYLNLDDAIAEAQKGYYTHVHYEYVWNSQHEHAAYMNGELDDQLERPDARVHHRVR